MNSNASLTFRTIAGALLALLFLVPAANAQIEGKIRTKDKQVVSGKIRWLPTKKIYVVTQTRSGGQSFDFELPLDKVDKVAVAKPAKFDAAVNAVKGGKAAAAVPVLQDIVKTYAMLQWDEPAARYLAEAQLASGDASSAITTCEGLIKTKPELAYLGELAPTYWQALLRTGKSGKLGDLITKAIAEGDREVSASALIMRGDMLMDRKEALNALKDGYLRVVVLYENVKSVQPEALFKAAKAFDTLNQTSNAEKMRTKLRTKYPSSEYAKKL